MSGAFVWLSSCGGLLGAVAWKATALLAMAWVVDRVWLRQRWLVADVLWTAALVGALVLPVGAVSLPQVTLPFWRAKVADIESPSGRVQNSDSHLSIESEPGIAIKAIEGATKETASLRQASSSNLRSADPVSPASVLATAVALYFLVCGSLLLRMWRGLATATRMINSATPIEHERWLTALARRKEQVGVRCPVRLLAANATAVPLTAGWRRPAIVVPADLAAAADDATIDATMLHELTHIARHDYLVHLVGKVIEALYWWNPLAWLATARLNAVRESICDGHCCWHMGSCEHYGQVLLAIAGKAARRRAGSVGLAMAHRRRLHARLGNLTTLRLGDHSWPARSRTAVLLFAVAVSLLSNAVVLGFQEPENVTVPHIVAALEDVEAAVQGLSGELHLIAKYNFVKPGLKVPPNMLQDDAVSSTVVGDFAFDCRFDGSGKIEADLVRTSIQFEGTEIARRLKIISLFDGERGKWIETQLTDNGAEIQTLPRYSTNFMQPNIEPLNLTTLHLRKKISTLLADGGAKIPKTEDVDGRPTVLVEVEPITVRADYIYQQRFWIDVERRVAVRRETMVQCGKGMPWGLHYRMHCQDYEEARPGIWLPSAIRIWNYHVTAEGQDHLVAFDRVDVKSWKVNESLSKIHIDDPTAPGGGEGLTNVPAAPTSADEEAPSNADSHRLKVIVVNEAGDPIADAQVFQNHVHRPPGAPADAEQTAIKNELYRTDGAGWATVTWEGESVDLRIWVSHPHHVPLHAMWSTKFQSDGGSIPAEFRFVLKPGTEIGGVVQDESGRPIAGAKVEIYSIRAIPFAMTPAGPTRRGVRPVPVTWLAEGDGAIVTDGEGRWRATNIPSDEDLDVSQVAKEVRLPPNAGSYPLRLRINHERYATYEGQQDEALDDAPSLTDLRQGEAIVVLKPRK